MELRRKTAESSIILLGAESQAATSFAIAYPECRFVFVTDKPIVDGWDLANVEFRRASVEEADEEASIISSTAEPSMMALCPRWIKRPCPLQQTLPTLEQALPGLVVPVTRHFVQAETGSTPANRSKPVFVVKGDLWHRPDAPMIGTEAELTMLDDPYGCGLVFQPRQAAEATLLVVGRRWRNDSVALGVFRLHAERFFRSDVIQAAETVDRPDLVEASLSGLAALEHVGLFTFVWLETPTGLALVSFRPVPRAVCLALRHAGVSLLRAPSGTCVASQGVRSLSAVHYASYQKLSKQRSKPQ